MSVSLDVALLILDEIELTYDPCEDVHSTYQLLFVCRDWTERVRKILYKNLAVRPDAGHPLLMKLLANDPVTASLVRSVTIDSSAPFCAIHGSQKLRELFYIIPLVQSFRYEVPKLSDVHQHVADWRIITLQALEPHRRGFAWPMLRSLDLDLASCPTGWADCDLSVEEIFIHRPNLRSLTLRHWTPFPTAPPIGHPSFQSAWPFMPKVKLPTWGELGCKDLVELRLIECNAAEGRLRPMLEGMSKLVRLEIVGADPEEEHHVQGRVKAETVLPTLAGLKKGSHPELRELSIVTDALCVPQLETVLNNNSASGAGIRRLEIGFNKLMDLDGVHRTIESSEGKQLLVRLGEVLGDAGGGLQEVRLLRSEDRDADLEDEAQVKAGVALAEAVRARGRSFEVLRE